MGTGAIYFRDNEQPGAATKRKSHLDRINKINVISPAPNTRAITLISRHLRQMECLMHSVQAVETSPSTNHNETEKPNCTKTPTREWATTFLFLAVS